MGACDIGGKFIDSDWRVGIQKVQEQDRVYYGYRDGYSGGANCCRFSYGGDKSDLTTKQIDKFVEERLERLSKRDGEVIKVGTKGYRLIKTTYKEETCYSPIHYKELFKGTSYTALLMEESYRPGLLQKIKGGSFEDMKKAANTALRNSNYAKPLYIVTKKKVYMCWGDYKEVKTTTRKTDEKIFVMPMYEYVYYGIAPI